MNSSSVTGKIVYGSIFILFIPALLVLWAKQTEAFILLPAEIPAGIGIAALITGILFLGSGMLSLIIHGKGLPMNAYPPPLFVRQGVYRYFSHPIYIGFCMICFGISAVFGSASGIWLITPTVIVGCTALVYGFERQDLEERFGVLPKPLIVLPANEERVPFTRERISVFILLFVPWIILYEALTFIGIPKDAVEGYFSFEQKIPVMEWTELFYVSTYFFVVAVPFITRSSSVLRTFTQRGLIATAFIMFCFLTIPVIATPRPFVSATVLGDLLQLERSYDFSGAAFPSFHVVWALLAASAVSKSFPRLIVLWRMLALAIIISCITTGMHSLFDVAGGIIAAGIVMRIDAVWQILRKVSEYIANSWKEWHINGIRIINHGAYAGAGTFAGLSMIGILLGPGAALATLIVAFCSLIAAGLWAQFIEGSPALLRPYGYYGGLIGGILGCVVAQFAGTNIWLLFAAFAVAGPCIQAFGRLRCLVQGCCHGHAANESLGIRYIHPRSRVCRLAGLKNIPIHPTPLYSILWNIVTGIILARFWSLALPPTFIAGMYLVLNGMGRFVEESFRGEPQTPILGKLRLYQLMAILSVVTGILFSMIRTDTVLPNAEFNWISIIAACIFGLFTWFALGVDFPNSNKRFARLV